MKTSNTRNRNRCKPWIIAAALVCACLVLPQAGLAAWGDDPIAVSVEEGNQTRPQVVYDGSGGYYVTWEDYELWGVFAQHYDVNGDTLWTSPIRVGGGEGDPYQEAVADGSGGLLVSYYNQDEGYSFVQRINADGNLAWEEDGVAVIDDHHCWIVPDGQGGAVVMSENGYVNKVSAEGTLPWPEANNPLVFSEDSRDH